MTTYQQARTEAERCLQCYDAPCTAACPAHIDVPAFITMIKSGNISGAAEVVKRSNAMANVCGKVCPEEVFCQAECIRVKQDRPIQIRELHFFATQYEWHHRHSQSRGVPTNSKSVAVIGAGPAGLACAFELSRFGYRIDVYDGAGLGGVPMKSIPSFRLAGEELEADVEFLSKAFTFHRLRVGSEEFERIRQGHDAVFIGVGLGQDKPLGLSGEHLQGVMPVLEFLETAKAHPKSVTLGRSVVIVGGGNVSLDAAATAKRLGASDAILIYRRGEQEMRVWKSELEEARKQGVEIRFLTNPVEILGENSVSGVRCRRTRLSEELDKSGRHIPVEVQGSDFVLEADSVILAIGQVIKSDWLGPFALTETGFLKVSSGFQTSMAGVFAGGDVVSGEGTVVQSVAAGKHAAHSMHAFLSRA